MTLTPEEKEEVIERASQLVAARIYEELLGMYAGAVAEFQVVPLTLAAALLGVSPQYARRILPVVDLGQRPGGVRWSDLRDVIQTRRQPAQREREVAI